MLPTPRRQFQVFVRDRMHEVDCRSPSTFRLMFREKLILWSAKITIMMCIRGKENIRVHVDRVRCIHVQ